MFPKLHVKTPKLWNF